MPFVDFMMIGKSKYDMNNLTYSVILAVFQTLLANGGMYFLKRCSPEPSLVHAKYMLSMPSFWVGILSYGTSFLLLILLIGRERLTFLVPFTMSLHFIVSAVVGVLLLDERLSLSLVIGMGIISIGVAFVALGRT